MKSYGGIWRQVIDAENLRAAWRRVRRNHSRSDEVCAFEADLAKNLAALQADLASGAYHPGAYRQFKIWDPKPRIISCAPIRDRVVHHALCGVITPLLERAYLKSSFACRKEKGSHAACAQVQQLTRRYSYFLKMDVHHYFDSISHARLKEVVLPIFREREVRALMERIIDTYHVTPGHGLPIGNLTSQWFANTYLNAFDHFLTERFGVPIVRYMDDVIVFAETKAMCWAIHDQAQTWLKDARELELKAEATFVAPVTEGVPFLGLRIFPGRWRLQHGRFQRTRRRQILRERQCLAGELAAEHLAASVRAMDGGVRWFGFRNILRRTHEQEILATEERAASGSNRHIRGGSWNNDASNATSSYRNNNNPSNDNNNYGFRLFSTMIRNSLSNSVMPAPEHELGTNRASGASSSTRQLSHNDGRLPLFSREETR